ncbi:uncharacterized protein LOC117790300 [Drosophila innubila]|uniref:uncharacterized protein LOC117790300 n=1 Tax=Drosophila innubila TaxID=198719 RepID=UPI00148CCBD1|nr:uncharacterized protein LOC117790300 [Drosophila innubila]
MSRLPSSTYNSVCLLLFLHFVWLLLLTTTPGATAKPTSSSLPADITASTATTDKSTHIVSFVNLKKANRSRLEFDFERNEAEATNSVHVQQLFSSLLQLQGSGNNSLDTDDAPVSERNTLDDELSLDETVSEQHESSTETPDAWHRIKLAIPVLEPVKHLLNAVGGGGVNDTHVRTNSHRLIGHHGVHHSPHSNHPSGNESSAIETEEDRETAIESTGFNLLEGLGMAGTLLLSVLQNLRQVFVASAGNASTAFSGGGGGGDDAASSN